MAATHTSSNADFWKQSFLMGEEFSKTKAYQRLLQLAQTAPDLTCPDCLTRERIEKFRSISRDFTLLYGFERVNDEIVRELSLLAEERGVFQQMESMLNGKPVNWIEGVSSEQRAVLHTSMRKNGNGRTSEIEEEAVRRALHERNQLRSIIKDISHSFDTMLFIGIGGSELGPHAICEALKPYWKEKKQVLYAGNVDPDELTFALSKIDPQKTIVVVVSKSGTTLETATNEARVREFFSQRVSSVRDHFIAVTCPGTPMDDSTSYRSCLHLFDYVGGRYSSTSMVGGILLAFMAGVEVFEEFLDGARSIDEIVLDRSLDTNIPLLMALLGIWNRNFLGYPTVAVIPYSSSLHRFPAHLQQCDMESNGKTTKRTGTEVSYHTGPVVWGEPGTNAQHSFFQLLHQGSDVIPVEFIGFSQSQYCDDFVFRGTSSQEKLLANMLAQAVALAQGKESQNPNKNFHGNRPSLILLGHKLTPRAVGALLAIYEHKIAFQGFLWGINSFDQEGVQLGKVLADRILHLISQEKKDKKEPSSSLEEYLVSVIMNH